MKILLKFSCAVLLLCGFLAVTSFTHIADEPVTFTGYFGDELLLPGKNYFCASQYDSVSFSTCRFYISDFTVYVNGKALSKSGAHLIDLFDTTALQFTLPPFVQGDVTEIQFNLGIDSTTNVAGVGSGDLDPTNGMYWAWQSGYINLKLEGNSKLCAKNRGEFQYHIGGYAAPCNALQRVTLKVEHYRGEYHLKADVQQFIAHADLKNQSAVMSPSAKAVELAKHAAEMFSLQE